MGRPMFGCLAVQKEDGLKMKTKTEDAQFILIRCWTFFFFFSLVIFTDIITTNHLPAIRTLCMCERACE